MGETSLKRLLKIPLIVSFLMIQSATTLAGFEDTISNFAYNVFEKSASAGSAFEKSQRMANLKLVEDGAGYYVFDNHDLHGRHWNRINFWYPYKSYSHEMTTTLEPVHIRVDQLIADLKKEAKDKGNIEIPFWWDHQDAMLENVIREFVHAVGTENFVISFVYSMSTHNISFYVNVDSNASHDTIHNTTLIKVLKDNIRRVLADPDAFSRYGREIRDNFTVSFGKPLIVFYILGTGTLYLH